MPHTKRSQVSPAIFLYVLRDDPPLSSRYEFFCFLILHLLCISSISYGDHIIASVTAGDFSKISFELYYRLEKEENGKRVLVAAAKTGMVCYDYDRKKIVAIPGEAKSRLQSS